MSLVRESRRPPRKRGPKRGYRPAGEPDEYAPAHGLRTRKAPRAYWARCPYPLGFGGAGNEKVDDAEPEDA